MHAEFNSNKVMPTFVCHYNIMLGFISYNAFYMRIF